MIAELVATRCPACGGGAARPVIAVADPFVAPDLEFPIGECTGCGLVRTLALPDEAERGQWYERHYGAFRAAAERRRGALRGLWQRACAMHPHDILARMPRGGRLLEVGCGDGTLLLPLARRATEALGVEPDAQAAARARARGLDVFAGPIERFEPGARRFDHVLLAFVLEQLLDPVAVLARLAKWLAPGGHVHVFCPDYDSPFRRELGRHWQLWHVPYQRTFFTERTLALLLKQAGLAPLRVRHYSRGGVHALGQSLANGSVAVLPASGRLRELKNRARGILAALRGQGDCLAAVAARDQDGEQAA